MADAPGAEAMSTSLHVCGDVPPVPPGVSRTFVVLDSRAARRYRHARIRVAPDGLSTGPYAITCMFMRFLVD